MLVYFPIAADAWQFAQRDEENQMMGHCKPLYA